MRNFSVFASTKRNLSFSKIITHICLFALWISGQACLVICKTFFSALWAIFNLLVVYQVRKVLQPSFTPVKRCRLEALQKNQSKSESCKPLQCGAILDFYHFESIWRFRIISRVIFHRSKCNRKHKSTRFDGVRSHSLTLYGSHVVLK